MWICTRISEAEKRKSEILYLMRLSESKSIACAHGTPKIKLQTELHTPRKVRNFIRLRGITIDLLWCKHIAYTTSNMWSTQIYSREWETAAWKTTQYVTRTTENCNRNPRQFNTLIIFARISARRMHGIWHKISYDMLQCLIGSTEMWKNINSKH